MGSSPAPGPGHETDEGFLGPARFQRAVSEGTDGVVGEVSGGATQRNIGFVGILGRGIRDLEGVLPNLRRKGDGLGWSRVLSFLSFFVCVFLCGWAPDTRDRLLGPLLGLYRIP